MVSNFLKNLVVLLVLVISIAGCSSVNNKENLSEGEYLNDDLNSESAYLNQIQKQEAGNDTLDEAQKNDSLDQNNLSNVNNSNLSNAPEVATPELLSTEQQNKEILKKTAETELPDTGVSVDTALQQKEELELTEEEDNPYFEEISEATPSPLKQVSSSVFSLMAKRLTVFNNFNIEQAIDKPFAEKTKPIVIDNVDLATDNLLYSVNLLDKFTVVARSKFVAKKDIKIENIRDFGGYIDTQLVVVKRFYNPDDKNYVYDVVFLQGNITDSSNLWSLNLSIAEKLEDTLLRENITNLDDYANVGYVAKAPEIVKNATEDKLEVLESANVDNAQSTTNEEVLEPVLDEDGNVLTDENGEIILQPATKKQQEEQSVVMQNDVEQVNETNNNSLITENILTESEEIDLQKKLIKFRTEKLVGLWEDVITGEIIEVRELLDERSKQNKVYGAFVVDNYYFKDMQPKINDMFVWNNGDLRFLFSSVSYNDYYLDEEKNVIKTSITPHDAKGLIIVSLPNRKYKYFRPLLKAGLLDKVDEEIYAEVKRTVKGVNTSHSYKTPSRYSQDVDFSKSIVENSLTGYAKFATFFGLMATFGTAIILSLLF